MPPVTPNVDASAGISRRTLVTLGAVGCAGLATGALTSGLLARAARDRRPPYRFLTPDEAALVIALCEEIVPRDDTPGATDASVVHFIDRQLATRLKRHQEAYRQGLRGLASACLELHRAPFAELAPETKIAFLQRVESGKIDARGWGDVAPAEFFRLLVSHTMQGFYGSPRHGGNRDYVSYRVLGLDYPQIIGRNRAAKR